MVLFLFVTWEQRKLGDVAKINMGQSPDGVNYTTNPNDAILVQGNADMADGWVSPRVYTKQITKKAHVGDLIFSVRAPVGEVGKTQYNVVIGRGVAAISGNEFIFQSLKWMNIFGYWTKLSAGSTFESINSDTLKAAEFAIPKEDEQIKIGEILLRIDNLITLHQRKQKCKFLSFPTSKAGLFLANSWEQRKLGDTIDFYSGLTYSPSDIVKDDGVFVLRSCNVQEGEIVDEDNVYVRAGAVNSDNVSVDDIIVVVRNGSRSLIGKHAKIKKNMPKTVIGAFMTGLRYKNSAYLNAVLNTSIFAREIEKDLGATINQITTGAFRKMVFPFPKQPEQSLIGNFFEQLDNLITLHQRGLIKIQGDKKWQKRKFQKNCSAIILNAG